MKKNEIKMIAIIIVIGVLIIGGIVLIKNIPKKDKIYENKTVNSEENTEEFIQFLEDETKINTSTKLNENKKLENLEIENIQLTNQNGQSILLANITNKGTTQTKKMLIDVILYDKQEKEIGRMSGIIPILKAGESTQLNCSSQLDYSNAYDLKIVESK